MTAPPAARRKRLLFVSAHRGTKENDLLIGGFVAATLPDLDDADLDLLEALLSEDDQLLWAIAIGAAPPPPRLDHALTRRLVAYASARAEAARA